MNMNVVFYIFFYLQSVNFYLGAGCMVGQHLDKKRYHAKQLYIENEDSNSDLVLIHENPLIS